MSLTFSSICNMIFFNNIIILVFYFLSKNTKLILKMGVKCFFFLLFLIMIRFIFPFEFFFTKTIPIKKILPSIYIFIYNTSFSILNKNIYIINILLYIWICGLFLKLLKALFSYIIFHKKIKTYKKVADKKILDVLNNINSSYKNKISFQIVYSENIESPFIFDIKSPTIIIPHILLSEEYWYYILKHEIAHYYHKDLHYKFFIELLTIAYWWNPFIYLLKSQFENLLEINIDLHVTKNLNNSQKLDYLECLLKVTQICNKSKNIYAINTFYNTKTIILSQRITIILQYIRGINPLLQTITLTLSSIITFFICSFCFILEPYSIPAEDQNDTFEINDYSAYYLIDNHNGTYDVFYNSKYIATVTEIFDSNIKIIKH